jgi:hypothetical protein
MSVTASRYDARVVQAVRVEDMSGRLEAAPGVVADLDRPLTEPTTIWRATGDRGSGRS